MNKKLKSVLKSAGITAASLGAVKIFNQLSYMAAGKTAILTASTTTGLTAEYIIK